MSDFPTVRIVVEVRVPKKFVDEVALAVGDDLTLSALKILGHKHYWGIPISERLSTSDIKSVDKFGFDVDVNIPDWLKTPASKEKEEILHDKRKSRRSTK